MRRSDLVRETTRRGVIDRGAALSLVAEHVLDDALADGALVRLFPGVYTLPSLAGDIGVRRRGALSYLDTGALSHLDALDVWGFLPDPVDAGSPIHVTTDRAVPFSDWPAVDHHRRRGFVADPPIVVIRSGMPVVRLEQAIIESWMLLSDINRRVPAIVALRERRTTAARLLGTLKAQPRARGAAEIRRVCTLVAAGCHSPLELWARRRGLPRRAGSTGA